MTLRDFISGYEWYTDYLKVLDTIKNNMLLNQLLKQIWLSKKRETEAEINEFYQNNILYSAQLIPNLDSELTIECLTSQPNESINALTKSYLYSKNKTVLEIGSGIGINSFLLASYGYSVVMADVDSIHFSLSKDIIDCVGLHNIEPVEIYPHFYDDNNILRNYDFDIIVCVQVLEHLIDPVKTAQFIYNRLSNDGTLYIETFFDDCHGEAPYHLNTNNKYQSVWNKEMEQIGFHPMASNSDCRTWRK